MTERRSLGLGGRRSDRVFVTIFLVMLVRWGGHDDAL